MGTGGGEADSHIINLINKSSALKKDKEDYFRLKTDDVSTTVTMDDCLHSLKDCSQNIAEDAMKVIYCTEGYPGISIFRSNLGKIISGDHPEESIYKLHNILMYATPFALCARFPNQEITPELLLFISPYEVVASQLQLLLMDYPFNDLSFLFKLQLRIERYIIPEGGNYSHEIYNVSRLHFQYGHRTGTLAAFPGVPNRFIYPLHPVKMTTYMAPVRPIGLGLKQISIEEKRHKDLDLLRALIFRQ